MIIRDILIHGFNEPQDILIREGKIKHIGRFESGLKEAEISIKNSLAYPGLINSHDHLDFNCFPQIGNHVYDNYTEWSRDIKKHNQKEIDSVLKIPVALRTRWGMYKNLLAGVTTVVNHGEHLKIKDNLLSVFQDCYSLHSIHFENNWKYQLNRLFSTKESYVIHVGEGTDKASGDEIDTLTRWNLFKRKIVGVHGVAMKEQQATRFHAMVWCPASNYFLLNATSKVDVLKAYTQVIFGTDSTLTANWNIWQHLRTARQTHMLTDTELFDSVTAKAAMVWNLNKGSIAAGRDADIIIVKRKEDADKWNAFYDLNPEDIFLVMHRGEVKLIDESISQMLLKIGFNTNDLNRIKLNDSIKIVAGDISSLITEIKKHKPDIQLPVEIA